MVHKTNLRQATTAGGAFPRWGYLDKFYANEYLARALCATILLSFASLTAYRLESGSAPGPTFVPARHPLCVEFEPLSYQPIPSVIPRPERAPHVRPSNTISGAIVPVENALADPGERWAPGAPVGPPGPGEGTSEYQGEIPIVETPGLGLPGFDTHVVVEKEPELVGMHEPAYPEIAREAHIEGKVLVRVLVDADGFVRDAVVVQSVLGLDEAALAAARTAVFKPALQQEHPVAVWVVVPIEFGLRD